MKTRTHYPPYATDCQRSPWQREIRRINEDGRHAPGRYTPQMLERMAWLRKIAQSSPN